MERLYPLCLGRSTGRIGSRTGTNAVFIGICPDPIHAYVRLCLFCLRIFFLVRVPLALFVSSPPVGRYRCCTEMGPLTMVATPIWTCQLETPVWTCQMKQRPRVLQGRSPVLLSPARQHARDYSWRRFQHCLHLEQMFWLSTNRAGDVWL